MNQNNYPFVTQKQIVSRLAESPAFSLDCLDILVSRQTDDEIETKTTKHVNKRGLRCSEATWMVQLAAKVRNNVEPLTDEEWCRLNRTLPIYRKQLASHFRKEQLAANPELAAQAAKFGL
jgi:hypothetical protein